MLLVLVVLNITSNNYTIPNNFKDIVCFSITTSFAKGKSKRTFQRKTCTPGIQTLGFVLIPSDSGNLDLVYGSRFLPDSICIYIN
jgi:hypothetical protein